MREVRPRDGLEAGAGNFFEIACSTVVCSPDPGRMTRLRQRIMVAFVRGICDVV